MLWFKRLALLCIVIYIAILAVVYFAQRRLLYFPPSNYLSPRAVNMPNMQEYRLVMEDGTALTAWWVPPSQADGKIVMVFHGNGSAVYSNYDIYADLSEAGHGVWAVAYPGYPGSEGKPSQAAIVEASVLQYDALQRENILDLDIVFYGTSLGSGVASQLAAQRKPKLLLLDAPFNSTLDMGKRQMPFLPVGLLMKDTYRSDEALKTLSVPLVWTHGTQDEIVPLSQGQKLFDIYDGPKIQHIIEGGQHTNLWALGGQEITLRALSD